MDNSIIVEIEYTDGDIRGALFGVINKINKLWIVSACALLVVGWTLYIDIKNGFTNYYNGLLFVFLLAYLAFVSIFYIYPINRYIDAYKSRRVCTFIFTEDSIEVMRNDVHSTCKWSLFNKASELERYFILLDVSKSLTILPKHSFKNEADIEEFKKLIGGKMKMIK